MTTLALIVDVATTPDCYVATWRDGEIFIEPIGSPLPPERIC